MSVLRCSKGPAKKERVSFGSEAECKEEEVTTRAALPALHPEQGFTSRPLLHLLRREVDYGNFESHLRRLQSTVYPEDERDHHVRFTKRAIQAFVSRSKEEIKDVLDVGCGQGLALVEFKALGMNAVGIALDDGDLKICEDKGFRTEKQDMSFLSFPDNSFDLVWARHCLEHSPMPMVTLLELERVTRQGGYLYVEVPQDDSLHIDNPNHYAVLSDRAWQELMRRTKFNLVYRGQWTLRLVNWVDIYWYYWLKKEL